MRFRRLSGMSVAVLVCGVGLLAQFERDAGRDQHEKVAEVLAALEIATAARVADIGAGNGFYSVRIARAMAASGRVTAVDVSEKALGELRLRLEREQVTNVDVTHGANDNPRLEADTFDAALIYNSYHEMTEYGVMLTRVLSALKPGGRLVIIEPIHDSMRSESRTAQTAKHEISDELTAQELEAAGFQIGRKDAGFRPFTDPRGSGAWWLIVARKPAR